MIQGKFRAVVPLGVLEHLSSGLEYNRNIDWEILRKDYPLVTELTNCLVTPILIHQHSRGEVVFPHLRCHIVVEGVQHLLIQDLSFEIWSDLQFYTLNPLR